MPGNVALSPFSPTNLTHAQSRTRRIASQCESGFSSLGGMFVVATRVAVTTQRDQPGQNAR